MTKTYLLFLLLLTSLLLSCDQTTEDSTNSTEMKSTEVPYALVIHGGAGTILKSSMTDEMEQAYIASLNRALDAGEAILQNGGAAIDAIEAAIMIMEDDPLFNAGKGAVFTHDGTNELDASIMLGGDLNAGAVGGVSTIKNPILAARAVMSQSPHVMMVGKGAEAFAASKGIEMVDPSYFYTESRMKSLERAKEKEAVNEKQDAATRHGTVGAVALDKNGQIAAGTSTGGMTNKRYNRIGDAPIIGAGTYADNETCGISATGHGEYFIRLAVAYAIHAQMKYGSKTLQESAHDVIHNQLEKLGGDGGIIGLDAKGNVVMDFNSEGMYRGYAKPGERHTAIYSEDQK